MRGTDNSNFEKKVLLRIEALKHAKNENVLDCYSGTGRIWNEIQNRIGRKLNITQIEKEKGKNPTAMCGDNMKIIPSIDLDKFGLIDLDAYGHPDKQMIHIFERNYEGIVCVTWIDTMFSRQPKNVVEAAGIEYSFYNKHSVVFNSLNDRLLENFLYLCRVKKYMGFFIDNKKYFYYQSKSQNYEQNLRTERKGERVLAIGT